MRLLQILVILSIFCSVLNADAESYPSRQNTKIIYESSAAIDLSARLRLVETAEHSIDILSFAQAPDEIGLPFLTALRNACKRGVRIRFLYDGIASWLDRDFLNRSAQFLAQDSCSAKIRTVSVLKKWNAGLQWDDFIHQKILLVDAEYPQEVAVIGGRGYTRFSTLISDSAFFIRPIQPGKPYLGTDLKNDLEGLWKIAEFLKEDSPSHRWFSLFLPQENPKGLNLSTEEQTRLTALLTDLKNPKSKNAFQPKSTTLISTHLFQKLLSDPKLRANRDLFLNESENELMEKISTFYGKIVITSYAIAFPPSLMSGLAAYLKRGNELEIYTTGRTAHSQFMPGGAPFQLSWNNYQELEKKSNFDGKLIVHSTVGKKFIHRKIILFIPKTGAAFFYTGTDNFTWSSMRKNDEWLIKVEDDKLARHLASELQSEENDYESIKYSSSWWNDFWYSVFFEFIRRNY